MSLWLFKTGSKVELQKKLHKALQSKVLMLFSLRVHRILRIVRKHLERSRIQKAAYGGSRKRQDERRCKVAEGGNTCRKIQLDVGDIH